MPQVTRFDRIVAELLRDADYRKAVCADPEAEIGKSKFDRLTDIEKAVIKEIACKDLTTSELDTELEKAGRSYSYFVTDW